jgi:uncharacterized protein YcfJ
MKALWAVILAGGLVLMQTGCATPPSQTTAATALGAGIGAGLGAILGNNFGGSRSDRALGAAAGALLGGMVGNQYGRQAQMQQQVNNVEQQQFYTTIWVVNSNGSKTPVTVRQTEGGQYIGPRGEYYSNMPTEEQLRKVYGM